MSKTMTKTTTRLYNGKPVVDATEPLTIHVGDGDIATAVPGDCNRCALAMATRRTTGRNVAIRKMYPLVEHEDRYVRYQLSNTDRGIINGFDEKGVFPAATFTLLVPRVKIGTHKPTGPHKVKSTGKRVSRTMRARTRDSRLPHDI